MTGPGGVSDGLRADPQEGTEPLGGHGSLTRALYNESRVLEDAQPYRSSLLLAAAEGLAAAHNGLLRALDYRAASPAGLAIKADVRAALKASGFTGPMGEVDSPLPGAVLVGDRQGQTGSGDDIRRPGGGGP